MSLSSIVFEKFAIVLRSKTLKQSLLTFSATLVNGILGVFFYIYLARVLGPSEFGLVSVAIVTLTLVADITNFGVNAGIVNFVSRYAKKDVIRSNQFLKLALKIKIIIGLFVFVAGYFLSPLIANTFFSKPEMTLPLRLVFLGVLSAHLFSFAASTLQAYQKFTAWSSLHVFTNALRLVSLFSISYFWSLDAKTSILIYLIYPFIGFLLFFMFVPYSFIKVRDENLRFKEFFKYNKWVASFAIISALNSRLDTFIIARFLDNAQVGIYSAANQLVQIIPQLISAMGVVISPKIASFTNKSDLLIYFKKIQIMVIVIALVGLCFIPFAIYLISILFGSEYLASINIFIILAIAMLIFLISVPSHQVVLYFFQFPQLFSWLAVLNLIIILILGWFMVKSYGITGVAFTILIVQSINFLIPFFWMLSKLKQK